MPKLCHKCSDAIPASVWLDGRKRNLQRRRYCLRCSPFASHNTREPLAPRRATSPASCSRCGRQMRPTQRKGRVCWGCRYGERSGRRMDRAYAIVGESCWRCGYTRGKAGRRVLDFHHVRRDDKSFPLDCRHVINLAWARVVLEIRKCVLLCANCHREVKTGLVNPAEVLRLYEAEWTKRHALLPEPPA